MTTMTTTTLRRHELRYETLTGRQKAAILFMALGPEVAATITQALTPAELEEITLEIAQIDRVPTDVAAAVLEEWRQTEEAAYSLAMGGVEYARELLEATLGPERAEQVLRRIEAQLRESAGFRSLKKADPQQLASVLRNEHPQTISLILAHLDPPHVAEVLQQFEPRIGADVLYRMARMEKVLPEALQVVERSLGSESALSMSQDLTRAGGPASVAAVLNLVTGSVEKELLDGIGKLDPELCEEIKGLMFVFEDIMHLDDKTLQRILREVEVKELALALKAASAELKDRIHSVMSQRAVNALSEEMEMLGPVRLRDVEAAQAGIVKVIRALEEAGEIVLGGAADEFVV